MKQERKHSAKEAGQEKLGEKSEARGSREKF